MQFSISYPASPHFPSAHTSLVADHFGLGDEPREHVVCRALDLPIEQGTIVVFTGPSGSGKSSLLRGVVQNLESAGGRVVWPERLTLPDLPLIDAIGLPFEPAAALLSSCGLAEPRLLLRRPRELSDGERWRFRLALALAKVARRVSEGPAAPSGDPPQLAWIAADEFTAPLDRTLAKVVAFNVRRQCDRTGAGFLLTTCHDDVIADLRPDLHVRCDLKGTIEVRNPGRTPSHAPRGTERSRRSAARVIHMSQRDATRSVAPVRSHAERGTEFLVDSALPSFAHELSIERGTAADWPAFARWHYRSHRVTSVRVVTLLLHNGRAIGICVFAAAPLSLAGRNRFFGLSTRWSRPAFHALNRQLVQLSRVVLHPTYRGAGIAAAFVRASCRMCPWPWIEALAQMGRINPFFEKAGFTRVEVPRRAPRPRDRHSAIYGTPERRGATKRKRLVASETHAKSRFGDPVYYIFDNRRREDLGPTLRVGPQGCDAPRRVGRCCGDVPTAERRLRSVPRGALDGVAE